MSLLRGYLDLQALVDRAGRRHAAEIGEEYVEDPFKRPQHQGGYQHITAEEWTEFHRVLDTVQSELRRLHVQSARKNTNRTMAAR